MAFRGLNVQFKVDLYMVCHRSQLQQKCEAFFQKYPLRTLRKTLFPDLVFVSKMQIMRTLHGKKF